MLDRRTHAEYPLNSVIQFVIKTIFDDTDHNLVSLQNAVCLNQFKPSNICIFQDIRTSTDAMTRLQGFVLLSSENRGGIRIEYAKAKIAD